MQQTISNLIKSQLGIDYDQAENHSEILINAFDHDHRILFWNKKAENYFGINKNAAIGERFESLLPYTANLPGMSILDDALKGKSTRRENEKYILRSAYYKQLMQPVIKEGIIIAALNIVWDVN